MSTIPESDDPARLVVSDVGEHEIADVVEPLFREYGEWVATKLAELAGIVFTESDLERHHKAFRHEIGGLLGPRGRLVGARLDDEPVAVGALKPIDDTTVELKRMYVRPGAQRRGVGRMVLEHLLAEAALIGYSTVRLETLLFMVAAQGLYRAHGFVETGPFAGSETGGSELHPITVFMALDLGPP